MGTVAHNNSKIWKSAEAEMHTAKAEAIEITISHMRDIEELLDTHEATQAHKGLMATLETIKQKHEELARRASGINAS